MADGARIWRLVRECGILDLNSCYAYLVLCRDFSSTCFVAERADRLVGFVTAYIPPERPDVVFVWQVGVAPEARQQGLAKALIQALWQSPSCGSVSYLEATVTPSNKASTRLFQTLAKGWNAELKILPGFLSDDFGPAEGTTLHEPENLVRIGPTNAH